MESLPQELPPDSLEATIRQVFAQSEYQWDTVPDWWTWLETRIQEFLVWLDGLRESHPVAYYLFVAANIVLLALILTHFGYVVWKAVRFRQESTSAARVVPAETKDSAWHLRQARRYADESQFTLALGHRFLALVLELDRRNAIAFHPAKTPAEYLRELGATEDGRLIFATLVRSLYRHAFGGERCTAEEWMEFDHDAGEMGHYVAAR